ncbi:MAG: hypothetical protein JXR63_01390 [Spirochaetales bacterium]|nr:hypothetical protein [Spirochaetales bacterium]
MKKVYYCLFFVLILSNCVQQPENNNEHVEYLENLGVEIETSERKDPNDNEMGADYNPFGKKVGVLFKQCEIFVSGVTINSENNGILDDKKNNYASLFSEADASWGTDISKKSVAADVDGDGLDEVIISLFYIIGDSSDLDQIALRVIDTATSSSESKEVKRIDYEENLETILTGDAGGGLTWEDSYLRQDLASGDLDGDGRDEIIITIGVDIIIFDDALESYKVLASFEDPNLDPSTKSYLRVDCGDFDQDGRDEYIIAHGESGGATVAQYTIYDDIVASQNRAYALSTGPIQTNDSGTQAVIAADVAVGDFDGDGLPEAAFSGKDKDGSGLKILVLDTKMSANSAPVFEFLKSAKGDDYEGSENYYIAGIAAGDIDGDNIDEIATYHDIFQVKNGEIVYHDIWGNEAIKNINSNYPLLDCIQIGDVTGDKRGDVVFVTHDSDHIFIYGVQADGDIARIDSIAVGDSPTKVTLSLPNTDNDSAVVEYLAHELLYTDPIVVAVIASPPYFTGINKDGVGGTSFGYIEGSSTTENESLGFSVGASIGTKFELPFGLAEAEATTTVTNSFNWGTATTHEISESWGYSTAVGEDKVVYTAVPFDVYYYRILSSADSSQIGETITVNVPRRPGKFHVTTTYFNKHTTQEIKIDEQVLQHSLGRPFTYANESEKDTLRANNATGLFSKHSLQVGAGTGTSEITIEDLTEDTSTFDYELDVQFAFEAETQGAKVGGSVGFQYGYSYSTSVTTGTYISGQVPDVPENWYNSSRSFKWGLMAYPMTHMGQKFTVVTYWID